MGNSLYWSYIMGILQLLNAQWSKHQEPDAEQGGAECELANELITQRKALLISEHNDVTLDYVIEYYPESNTFVIVNKN